MEKNFYYFLTQTCGYLPCYKNRTEKACCYCPCWAPYVLELWWISMGLSLQRPTGVYYFHSDYYFIVCTHFHKKSGVLCIFRRFFHEDCTDNMPPSSFKIKRLLQRKVVKNMKNLLWQKTALLLHIKHKGIADQENLSRLCFTSKFTLIFKVIFEFNSNVTTARCSS